MFNTKKLRKKLTLGQRLYRARKEIRALNHHIKHQDEQYLRLAQTNVIFQMNKADTAKHSLKELCHLSSTQAEWLQRLSNGLSRPQNNTPMSYAICETTPGVQLHPILWLPNPFVSELFDMVAKANLNFSEIAKETKFLLIPEHSE